MRLPTPVHIKSAVIDAWLMGKTRDNIASEFNVSTGSVSNITEQWQNMIGVSEANNLRELGLALKKARITPGKCADGLRINNIINKLGIDDDHLFDFVNKLYNGSIKERLEPADTAKLVKAINAFPEINSILDIPKYINKKLQEKIKIDEDINYKKRESEKLDQEIKRKRKEIQDLKDDLETFRKEMQDEKKDFLLFRDAKGKLKDDGIEIHLLEPLIHVIKNLKEMGFRPLSILSEFSDINAYRDLVGNKERKIKDLESHIQDLKAISDNYDREIASNEPIVISIKRMENLGINASDIEKIERTFSNISKKIGLEKEETKIRFFRYMEDLDTLLTLEQDIFKKKNELSMLNSEISSGSKVTESHPVIFYILQKLITGGLNEDEILVAFKIFATDLCNKMPYGEKTYLECLSKDVDKYKTIQDALKSRIIKFILVKSNLEVLLFSASLSFYFYSMLLNAQMQIQKKLCIILIYNFTYLPLICIVKGNKNLNSSEFKFNKTIARTAATTKILRKKRRKGINITKNCKCKNKRNEKKGINHHLDPHI